MLEKNTISTYLSTYLSIGSICMYPPPLAQPSPGRRSASDPRTPSTPTTCPPPYPTFPPVSHLPATCKIQQTHLPSLRLFLFTSPISSLAPLVLQGPPLPIPATPLFTFSPLFIAPARLFRNCPHLPVASLSRPHLPTLLYTSFLKLSVPPPPSPCPLHGFHATNCYPCFYTTLPDFLTVSEQPFVTFGSEAPCLPDLARVLRCNLPPLVLQAAPDHTTSSLRRVPCCFPLSSTPPYLPSLVKHLFVGSAAPGRQPMYNTVVSDLNVNVHQVTFRIKSKLYYRSYQNCTTVTLKPKGNSTRKTQERQKRHKCALHASQIVATVQA